MNEPARPEERQSRVIPLALLACAAVAIAFSVAFAWYFRDWSLTGFFLAVSVGAAGIAAVLWPDRRG
jgi:high-affinity Fe2+/Pb2+ permease